MNFYQWTLREKSTLYYKRDLFKWTRKGDSSADIHYNKGCVRTLEEAAFLKHKVDGGSTELLPFYTMNRSLAYGPKIIRPGKLDFGSLEATDINLHLEDYSQPYDCMVIELPENYRSLCEAPDAVYGVPHRPEWVIIAHERVAKVVVATIYLSSDQLYSMAFNDTKVTLKVMLDENSEHHFKNSLPADPKEQQVFRNVVNACLNCCLFLDTFGSKCLGPENPKHYQRLQHFVDVARKSKDAARLERARRDLIRHPVYFGFDQEVTLFDRASHAPGGNGDSGITKAPHWRRGHWRMQAHGRGNSERKRIRIAPVLVNEHLMVGDESATQVTYKV